MKNIPETVLQKSVHKLLSDPSVVRETTSNKRLQILSPGRHNVHAGPDFKEMAILINGIILVGDAEFHRNSSEWFQHKHHDDPEYNSVILHIILNDDNNRPLPFESLIMSPIDLQSAMMIDASPTPQDIDSIHDLQDFALIRLLRKASEVKKILEYAKLNDAIRIVASKFIERYNKKKRRPVHNEMQFKEIIQKLSESEIYNFLQLLSINKKVSIPEQIQHILKTKIASEGSSLRQEIILNCIIPLALCLANEESRIELFLWFWSTPSLNKYGVLNRRFENIPQNYIWQQQGMLEYLKEFGRKQNIISDVIKNYGFAEVLDFYKIGRYHID